MNIDKIVADVNKVSYDATDIRVDVCMDLLGHTSRTKLTDVEFGKCLYQTLAYATSKSSAKNYNIVRNAGKRFNGNDYVVYTVVLN